MSKTPEDVIGDESQVKEVPGDLFGAPQGSCLIHACNPQGVWGAGIAKVFKQKYPAAYECYKESCNEYQKENVHHDIVDLHSEDEDTISVRLPLGTALVIPPQPEDFENGRKKHWIVCLFNSSGFGKEVDSPEAILNHTFAALQDLDMQLVSLRDHNENSDDEQSMPGQLYSCRFNSGLFAVPWEQTREVIEEVGLSMTVVYPEGE
ncbi:ADP-ribose 1''-phosphate phosphatase [Penicillium argentinense]|uniref:ADP-ribose 1''-phosphate phosphatase n=1 Tax=Penicillium argentinense TaxID=1131581 RepID=A0A9W9FHE3_9EURO|nr:ADP-ribose 1''-phosphate phosphatase [Penicillium argentinense]KAJ5100012.1 ADP-ribose 1''-phosphate phosphatase [Penicillium argentinense]